LIATGLFGTSIRQSASKDSSNSNLQLIFSKHWIKEYEREKQNKVWYIHPPAGKICNDLREISETSLGNTLRKHPSETPLGNISSKHLGNTLGLISLGNIGHGKLNKKISRHPYLPAEINMERNIKLNMNKWFGK
jgi:hypothetical protein